MQISFKRIVSSGRFIPEVEGLRFIAILSVVVSHLSIYLIKKDLTQYKDFSNYSFIKKLLSHGNIGVPIFFVISGFILGTQFIKFHNKKQPSGTLKQYFLRRLTRLEPPYILTMSALFVGAVYINHSVSLDKGVEHYLASIFYCNNFMFPDTLPILNTPAWSLEVEIQFYILAPLLSIIFIIKSSSTRRIALISIILLSLLLNQFHLLPFVSIINYIHYFFLGFLLTDLYTSNSLILPKTNFDNRIAFLCLSVIWLIGKEYSTSYSEKFLVDLLQTTCIFFLFYYVLIHKVFKFLTYSLITTIGGMCYSIYLLHYPIISFIGKGLLSYSFSNYSLINTFIYVILLLSAILTISSAFFLLVERPCMDKDWIIKIFKRPISQIE